MYQTPKRVYNTFPGTTKISNLFFDSMSNGTARSAGDVWDGMCNGIATGFGGDILVAEDTSAAYTPSMTVAASGAASLATPAAYWFQKQPFRVRVGSTGAGAVPATSGLVKVIAERPEARGVLRMGLADVDAAAQIILDQGGLPHLDTSVSFEVHFDIANVSNGSIAGTRGFADFGVFSTAVGVNPAAVPSAAGYFFKIVAGNVELYKLVGGTATLLGSTKLPKQGFVLSICYDAGRRSLFGCIDGLLLGEATRYHLPAATTTLSIGARVCHLAAYTTLADSPLVVDVDGIVANQMSYGTQAGEA
jgi:hypothetical protein